MTAMKLMNWTTNRFPASMRSLSPTIRAQAIEIANTLVTRENMDRDQAVQVSIVEARRRAKLSGLELSLSSTFSLPQA